MALSAACLLPNGLERCPASAVAAVGGSQTGIICSRVAASVEQLLPAAKALRRGTARIGSGTRSAPAAFDAAPPRMLRHVTDHPGDSSTES